jgi:DDE superfamily endonuclease
VQGAGCRPLTLRKRERRPWQNPLPQVVKKGYSPRISCCGISRRLGVHDHSGKKKDHTVKHVLLVNALLVILLLSDTHGGRGHDLRIAEATPYPLPAGSGLVQDLGFLSFTLPEVAILMPTKKPRGAELTLEQHRANQALHQRRLRIEHGNSSVKRCRMVQDRIRLWKEGVRDLVMALCGALHNFRVRLHPWLPMI